MSVCSDVSLFLRVSVEAANELFDVLPDLVADGANFLERERLGVGELPADPAQAGRERTYLFATGRDSDIGPREIVGIQPVWNVVVRVDADLLQRLENQRMSGDARIAAGAAGFVPPISEPTKQPFGHHAATGVADTDEQHPAQVDSSAATGSPISAGRVGSPRTNW
jgi:hypothetical protein